MHYLPTYRCPLPVPSVSAPLVPSGLVWRLLASASSSILCRDIDAPVQARPSSALSDQGSVIEARLKSEIADLRAQLTRLQVRLDDERVCFACPGAGLVLCRRAPHTHSPLALRTLALHGAG